MPETLEVEVIAIDGAPPPSSPSSDDHGKPRPAGILDWRQLLARILKLDRRWWPLWVLLGLVFLSLLVIVGLVVAGAVVAFGLVRAVFRLFVGGRNDPGFFTVIRRN